MKKPTLSATDPRHLRRKAQEKLAAQPRANPVERPRVSSIERTRLSQELEIHRIELEMQNEHLRATQSELETSLDRYTQLFDFAPIGYATLGSDDTIREINHKGALLLDEERRRVIGKRFAQFIAPSQRQAFNEMLTVTRAEETHKVCEFEVARTMLERPYLRFTTRVLTGVEPTILLAFEDVTAQKRAEAHLLRADAALREADRRKDDFLAVLSHELRTPLSSLLMHGQLLQQGDVDETSVQRAGAAVERSARTLTRLVDDLLDVSRIIAGKLVLNREPASAAAVVQAAVDAIVEAARRKNVELTVDIDPAVPPLFADPTRLQQAVWNLLTNAVKFSRQHGRVDVKLTHADRQAVIAVRDQGAGIDPEFLPNLFVRFSQAERTVTRSAGGLGLGLSIAHSIVEAHGGEIRAQSAGRGKGSTFTIVLPLAGMASVLTPSPRSTRKGLESRLDGRKVLLVEDDPGTRATLTHVLERAGARVREADRSAEAIRVLETFRPHAVICDIGLPEEDGCTLLRRIRSRGKEHGGDVPAMALTAFGGEEDRARTRAAGFQIHLVKPIDIDGLLFAVTELLANSKPSGRPTAPA